MSLQKKPLLNETACNLLITQLQDNFNIELQELDNQYDDGSNLEPLSDQSIYISDKIETLDCPAVYILFGNMAFNYTENPNYLNASTEVAIVLSLEDIGADRLTRKAWRYSRILYGIFNLQDLNDLSGRLKIKTVPKRMAQTDARIVQKLKKEEQKFRMDIVLELELQHYENIVTV